VTFGLARYGYGLMLPDLRAALHLDSATLGVIGSGSFAAYMLAAVSSGLLAARVVRAGLPAVRRRVPAAAAR
jgi:fucose permease